MLIGLVHSHLVVDSCTSSVEVFWAGRGVKGFPATCVNDSGRWGISCYCIMPRGLVEFANWLSTILVGDPNSGSVARYD